RSLQRVASAQRPEILLAARVSPTGKFSNLSVTACPVMQGQVQLPETPHLPLSSETVIRPSFKRFLQDSEYVPSHMTFISDID
ncbi:hypothetical protein, partial [Burkholderia gladioli]|uniref:hypothetical protein n=1 Tax=Burkholderia gladioli TaxID=28095 RepID=UPI001ABA302E